MKQNKIIYLILLQLFICFNIYSQELIKDTFIDPRDNQTYGVVKFGNTKLFAENLRYKTNTSWSFNDDTLNDIKQGRYYTYEDAVNVCPVGWELINLDDESTNDIVFKYWNFIKKMTVSLLGELLMKFQLWQVLDNGGFKVKI